MNTNMDMCPSPYLVISFNHKTDGEHVHFTKSDDSDEDEEEDGDDKSNADSDEEVDDGESNADIVEEEDDDGQSNASADDLSTVENPTTKPSGYFH